MAGDSYEEKAKLILQSRRNANVLVDLLEKVDSTCKDQVIKALSSLEIVFKGFFSQRLWYDSQTDPDIGGTETLLDTGILGSKGAKDDKKKNEFGRNAERIYASWAHRQYLTFVKDLLRLCGHTNRVIQRSALDCLMGFLVSDYNATISNLECNPKQCYFPTTLFSRIIDSIFFNDCNAVNSRITYFEQRYLGFADIQFYTLKSIHRISNGQSNSITMNENVKSAICSLLLKMSSGEKDQDLHGFVIDDTRKLQKFIKGSSERRRLFSDAWLSVMHLTLPTQNLKMILVNLHEKIMPQMDDPKLLIDFLTDCYNLEGPIALLALNGLFLLIQNYNIDYPDFFKKLYNLLDAHTFEVKYRDRLLVLTDLFLTSINLPRYMAAAFIKRLARICLRVSPDTIRVILVLIENLMKRHPSCKVLIHRKINTQISKEEQATSDPYKYDESDPARCNALSSSLWELKTLEQHYCSEVQLAVKVFSQPFGRQENDLNPYLHSSYADVFDKELSLFESDDSVVLNFKKPNELFNSAVYEKGFWSLE